MHRCSVKDELRNVSSLVSVPDLCPLQEFEEDVSFFRLRVEDMERRLGAIFCRAFDDAPGLDSAFKVC